MLGTKCPSITSRWIQSAPAASTARDLFPSLEKSEARIDGAMTRGRDANWADMCAFPKTLSKPRREFPGNTRQRGGQCGQNALAGRKNLPPAAPIAGAAERGRRGKPIFYWVFCAGTGFADPDPVKVGRTTAAFVGVLPCCLPLAPPRPQWTRCNRCCRRNRIRRKPPALPRTRPPRSIPRTARRRQKVRLQSPVVSRVYADLAADDQSVDRGAESNSTASTTSASSHVGLDRPDQRATQTCSRRSMPTATARSARP